MTNPVAQRIPASTAYRLLAGESVHLAPTARQPVDYARILGDHRVLYCGENHWDLEAKADLTLALPALRQAGMTHLGIEMYFSDRKTQAVLDTHFERRDFASLQALRQRLYYFGHQYGCAPAYERLVTTAIAHGIRVVGINDYPTHRGLANAAWAATIADLLLESDEDHAWPDYVIHPATRHHGSDRDAANAELGLPDDAYWAQRWRTFHTQHWERYVDRDDPAAFGVGEY